MIRVHSPRAVSGLAALALFLTGSVRAATGPSYVGSTKCRACHLKEHASWSKTKMARSFELLKPGVATTAKTKARLDPGKDYTTDTSCLPCHGTGYGKPGGFVDAVKTPDLADVGCEMCHGPGGTYIKPPHMTMANKSYKRAELVKVGLIPEPTEELCASCQGDKRPVGTVVGKTHFLKVFRFESD